MRHPRNRGTGRGALTATAVLASLLLAVVLGGGCTSDPANSVGSPLVEATFDTTLVPLVVDQIDNYTTFVVTDTTKAVHQQELLYMGEEQGTRSRIMANFDFAFDEELTGTTRDTVAFPDSLFTERNIKNVKFSLIKPDFYRSYYLTEVDGQEVRVDVPGQPVDLYYVVQQLEAPFDSTQYVGYPNPVPAVLPAILNFSDYNVPNDFNEPFMRLDVGDFVEWWQNREQIGIIVELDAQSDPGLVGYASRDLGNSNYSHFDDLAVGTAVAPNFVVEFDSTYVGAHEFFLMDPYADTSTFETVPDVPTDPGDHLLVRTGLRSYPAMFFDFSALPENAHINRAALRLVNDTAATYGRYQALVVSEIDSTEVGEPLRDITLDQLDDTEYLYQLSGGYFDPAASEDTDQVFELEVTTAAQRYVNRVYDGSKAMVVTAGEYIAPIRFRAGAPVSMFYSQFNFYGMNAPEELRPQLRITYSLIEELVEGDE